MDYGRPYVDRLVSEGMVVRADGTLVLTDAGRQAADRLFAARRDGLRELLADWSPEEYAELGELLNKLSRALLDEDADRDLAKADATFPPGEASKALEPAAGADKRAGRAHPWPRAAPTSGMVV